MIISKYGIRLTRLTTDHLELVREKRNSDSVRKGMFFRDLITPEMQREWFATQDNRHNYHFLIRFEDRFCGMISGKNVDFINGTSEGGIFMWEEDLLGTPVPVIASVIMAELTFNLLGLKKTYAETRSDNKAALRYNFLLGYEVLEELQAEQKVLLALTSESFNEKGSKFLRSVRTIAGDPAPLSWNDIHFDHVKDADKERLYRGFPALIQEKINHRL